MVKIKLETKSPVYIGNTGNEYSRSEFAFANINKEKKLIKLNLDLIAKELYTYDKDLFNDFIEVISDAKSFKNIKNYKENNPYNKNDKIDLKGLHGFLYNSIRPRDKDLFLKILLKFASYRCKLAYGVPYEKIMSNGETKKFRSKIESTDDIGVIKENLKTNSESFIPGSTIKGAVRNALLYSDLNLGQVRNKQVSKEVKNKEKSLNRMMNFIQFSDSFNTIKEPTIYGVESIGTNKNTFSFFETIGKDNSFELEYRNTFNSSVHSFRDLNGMDLSIESIFEKLYEFSEDLIKEEIRFIEEEVTYNDRFYHEVDDVKFYEFYEILKEENEENSPLLRIGQGSGALTVSQLLNIKNSRSPRDFTAFRNHNHLGRRKEYDFPKTRKLVVNTLEPLGWVKLSKI